MNFKSEHELYPLTYPQKGIWYTEKLYPGTSIGNIAATLKVMKKIDFDVLQEAINLFIKHNDSMRIHIIEEDGEPYQYVSNYENKKIDFLDFSNKEITSLYEWDSKQTITPFIDFDTDLYYFAMIKTSNTAGGFYIKLHHLIGDAWTLVSLGNNIMEYYNNIVNNIIIENNDNPSYIEYVVKEKDYISSNKYIKDEVFWKEKFSNIPELTTLKSKKPKNVSTEANRKTFVIPSKLSLKIREFCKINKTSIFTLFYSSLCMYINRTTAQKDIIIGVPVLNRTNAREKKTLGMFISIVPLKVHLDESIDFATFIRNVSNEWLSTLRHSKYPYEQIIKCVREKYNTIEKLYDIAISYQNARFIKNENPSEQEGRWHFNGYQKESLYIHINDREDDGKIILDYDFLTELFYPKEIEFLHDHILRLLWHALDNPSKKVCTIDMISEKEKHMLLYEYNNTQSDYPKTKTIHELFEEQVERTPDNTALVFEGKEMSYIQLNQRANQLARTLRNSGVKPDTIVGIMLNRSFEMIIAIMAVLKAGGAYVPIDPEYPEERILYMLKDSNVHILITEENLVNKTNYNGSLINVDNVKMYHYDNSNLNSLSKYDNIAYTIYTSGSTGKPKGVIIEHKSVINFIFAVSKIMDFSCGVSVLSLSTMSFDIFVFEIFPSLINGLKIYIANEEEQIVPYLMSNLITKNKIQKIIGTPAKIMLLIENEETSGCFITVDEVMVGGDVFTYKLLNRLKQISNTSIKIINGYGPTETTVGSIFKNLSLSKIINIGKPISNTQVYILDKYLNPVPIGMSGELFISGDGVSRGYLNNLELTNKKFLPNPFISDKKMYATGDLARWYPMGEIEFLGRIDQQVKIKGLRIELGEIKASILNIEGIVDAVVAVQVDKKNMKHLCAYYISDKETSPFQIKQHLLNQLPDYMIPSYFLQLKQFPITPNGKIDKMKLPMPNFNKLTKKNFAPPTNETERKLVDVWGTLLNIDNIGINHDFFELGGDSLTVIQLQVLLLKNNWNLKVNDLYKYKTIRELSKKILSLDEISATTETNETNNIPLHLDNNYNNHSYNAQNNIIYNNVLLTGATGYLGIHVLDSLLSYTSSSIYCLIRAKNIAIAKQRLNELLKFYFDNKYDDIIDKRVFIVKGDISIDNLALDNEKYITLAKTIDIVIHSAALVKYYGDSNDFEKINVTGTENISKLCLHFNKPLYYISSMGISGQYLLNKKNDSTIFTEKDLYIGQNLNENIYVKSKFEAECLIHRYIKHGLKGSILRVGNLTSRYSDGKFQHNIHENYFYNILKSIIELGSVSQSVLDNKLEFTPVDLCSKSIIALITTTTTNNNTFHIYNNNIFSVKNLVYLFKQLGINIEILESEAFKSLVLNSTSNSSSSDKIFGIGNYFDKDGQLTIKQNIKLSCDITLKCLNKNSFEWPYIDALYLKKIIDYMKIVEFIK